MTSGGNNFNSFPQNQMTKFPAIYTVKVNLEHWGLTHTPDDERHNIVEVAMHMVTELVQNRYLL